MEQKIREVIARAANQDQRIVDASELKIRAEDLLDNFYGDQIPQGQKPALVISLMQTLATIEARHASTAEFEDVLSKLDDIRTQTMIIKNTVDDMAQS